MTQRPSLMRKAKTLRVCSRVNDPLPIPPLSRLFWSQVLHQMRDKIWKDLFRKLSAKRTLTNFFVVQWRFGVKRLIGKQNCERYLGCGTVGRPFASDIGGHGFKSCHRQCLSKIYYQLIVHTKNKVLALRHRVPIEQKYFWVFLNARQKML